MLTRDYLVTKLYHKGPALKHHSASALVQLVCRLTKYAWLDEGSPEIRQIVSHCKKFLEGTFAHCVIGLRMLNELVFEMNFKTRNRSLTQHRKVAVSFRDAALFEVFEVSLTMLNSLATRALDLSTLGDAALQTEQQLLEQALTLLERCLTFDFIGVLPDESSDDATTLQVPSAWRDRIQTGSTLRLLFNLYKGCTTGKIPIFVDASAPVILPAGAGGGGGGGGGAGGAGGGFGSAASAFGTVVGAGGGAMRDFALSPPRAAKTLECLSLMVSVRRTLFASDADRKRFLTHTMRGVCDILREKQGLRNEECYHGFCRLLSRIKNNQQLNELIRAEGYHEWLEMTAAFTIDACSRLSETSNSMPYILGFWARLVSSVPYARVEQVAAGAGVAGPALDVGLDRYVPGIVGAYVNGRVAQLMGPQQAAALDELQDLDTVEDQLENLPIMCRYLYSVSCTHVQSVIEPIMAEYKRHLDYVRANAAALAATANPEGNDCVVAMRLIECQLAWLVAISGAIIGGGGAHSSGASGHAAAMLRASGLGPHGHALGGAGGGGGAPDAASEESFDAVLCRNVFVLIEQGNAAVSSAASRLPSAAAAATDPVVKLLRVDARLETAFLYFMDQFRKAFITDASGMPPPLPQPKLGEEAWSGSGRTPSAGGGRGASDGSSSSMALMRSDPLARPPAAAGSGGVGDGSGPGGVDSFDSHGGLLAMLVAGAGGGGRKVPASYADMLESATGRERTFLLMFKHMGLGEHPVIVAHLVLKLANNLRYWAEDDAVIRRSNEVLRDLVFSFAAGRLLLSIPAVTDMLLRHGPEHFPFLQNPRNVRHRTTFYTSLARLVFFEDDSERFEPFILPLAQGAEALAPSVLTRSQDVHNAVVGACRDMRGVVAAAHNRSAYLQCFAALHPTFLDTMARSLEAWSDQPVVTTSVLKFFAELVMQRGSRIQFGNSSASGILLFKSAAQAVVSYGQRVLASPHPPPAEAYAARYKGVAVCAQILSRCMEGGFVNFGVMALYRDGAFTAALTVVLQLLLSVPPEELMGFPKLAVQYMTLMHYAFRSHLEVVTALPPEAFLRAVTTISQGVDSLDPDITAQAAFALDQLATHFVKLVRKDSPVAAQLRAQVSANAQIFTVLMGSLFVILVFSEQLNHFTLARPMLPIILAAEMVEPGVLERLRDKLVADQPLDQQGRMREEFGLLTKDISRSLDVLNRDRL